MKDDELMQNIATVCVIIVVAPIVIGGASFIITSVANVGINIFNKVNFKKQMKKGLKDGSICKINGEYYKVEDVEEA